MSTLSKRFGKEFSRKGNEVFRKIETLPIPVIAAVNGYALGGGVELALSCDLRICSTNAIFGMPEVKLGINPGFGGTQRLARLIRQGMAKQMIYGGSYIDAYEALRIGLVNAVYPQGELLEQAKLLAKNIAKNGRNAVAASKKAINEGMQVDIEQGIKIEEYQFGECFEQEEQINGMKNFLEKGKKSKKKQTQQKEVKKEDNVEKEKEQKKKEEEELPKGELIPTTKFADITYLKEMTTPTMPAILSVGNKNLYNSMTIEWGSLGVAFKKPVFTVYVKPDRYTYEVMEKSDIFTVNFIERKLLKKFAIYGTKSGKDINKEEEAGTHIKFLEKGGVTFDEAVEVYVCKIMAKSIIDEKTMDPYIKELYRNNVKVYKTEVPHVLYIGEILYHYVRES
jgi:enoyl-CoA hydratase